MSRNSQRFDFEADGDVIVDRLYDRRYYSPEKLLGSLSDDEENLLFRGHTTITADVNELLAARRTSTTKPEGL